MGQSGITTPEASAISVNELPKDGEPVPVLITILTGMAADRKITRVIQTGKAFGIMAKLRAAIKCQVPDGFEDETGFHVGMDSAQDEFRRLCYVQDLNEFRTRN